MEDEQIEKIDFRTAMKAFYAPSAKDFVLIDVPTMQFVKTDGQGDPNSSSEYAKALGWLYGVSYAIKFASKAQLGKDYTVPPLEGLWWADDMKDFLTGNKQRWRWTMMIMLPDFITRAMFEAGIAATEKKLGAVPNSLRLDTYAEGLSVQIMFIGPYAEEGPVIKRLHEEFIPGNGLTENGLHHEIYLSDPRKVAPAKLKTVIRQPVKRVK